MKELIAVRPKIYSYFMDDVKGIKRDKRRKKRVIKRIVKFNHYNDFNNKPILQ